MEAECEPLDVEAECDPVVPAEPVAVPVELWLPVVPLDAALCEPEAVVPEAFEAVDAALPEAAPEEAWPPLLPLLPPPGLVGFELPQPNARQHSPAATHETFVCMAPSGAKTACQPKDSHPSSRSLGSQQNA